jgi:hypothetical protein
MSFQPTPKHNLALWNLLITGTMPAKSQIKPELSPAERQALIDAGLIKLVSRKQLREEGLIDLKGNAEHIVLTDKAWDWATENSTVEFPKGNTSAATPVLQALLANAGIHLQTQNFSWAEFLRPQSQSIGNLEETIRAACAKISGDRYNVRVRLSELRPYLNRFSRAEVDGVLNEMELSEKIVLMPIDDPQGIRPEDEDAALDVGGSKRHILYMKG